MYCRGFGSGEFDAMRVKVCAAFLGLPCRELIGRSMSLTVASWTNTYGVSFFLLFFGTKGLIPINDEGTELIKHCTHNFVSTCKSSFSSLSIKGCASRTLNFQIVLPSRTLIFRIVIASQSLLSFNRYEFFVSHYKTALPACG